VSPQAPQPFGSLYDLIAPSAHVARPVGEWNTSRLVIQRNTVDYLAPITRDFEARCTGLPPAQFEEFLRTLDRYGKARTTLAAVLTCNGEKAAAFSGDYVAAR